VDGSGRTIVADWHSHTIRRIDHFGNYGHPTTSFGAVVERKC